MFTTIINDCKDDNARGRQESRVSSLMETGVSFIGVDSDLEAGMQLIDVLDATEGRRGLVLVNVAPRGGHTVKWENGTPFGYFWHKETLIIASVDGYTLSAVKSLGITEVIHLLDTHSAAAAMLESGFITKEAADHIPTTQFRSFDFIPRAGAFLLAGKDLPSNPYPLTEVPPLPKAVWHIDNFGNCKTTLTVSDVIEPVTPTRFGTLNFVNQLRDVADGASALTAGSSGLGSKRFLELVIQRGNFANAYDVHIGDDVFTHASHFRRATN